MTESTLATTASDQAPWASLRTSASHTIGVSHLLELLTALPADASAEEYRDLVVEQNFLGRPTAAGRARTYRHLRELYLLDPTNLLFSALRRCWQDSPTSGPLLAGLLAFTRDEVFRATWPAVAAATPGERVTSLDLSRAARSSFSELSDETVGKIGRNTGASWTQTGHLRGRASKVRLALSSAPAAVAYAVLLAHLDGRRGAYLLDTPWFNLLDIPDSQRIDAVRSAHLRGLLTLQTAGEMVDISVSPLLGVAE